MEASGKGVVEARRRAEAAVIYDAGNRVLCRNQKRKRNIQSVPGDRMSDGVTDAAAEEAHGIVGMQASRTYHIRYTQVFMRVFSDLAQHGLHMGYGRVPAVCVLA